MIVSRITSGVGDGLDQHLLVMKRLKELTH